MAILQDTEGFYYSTDEYLGNPSDYAISNARLLASMLINNYGWTEYGCAGVFSAISFESQFNPQQIQSFRSESYVRANPTQHVGCGYVQWSPGMVLLSWCDSQGLDWRLSSSQCQKLEMERRREDVQYFLTDYRVAYWQAATGGTVPPQTMDSYVTAQPTMWSPLQMAAAWVLFYERPGSLYDVSKYHRNSEWVTYWYQVITGQPLPTPPAVYPPGTPIEPPSGVGRSKMPIYMYPMFRR